MNGTASALTDVNGGGTDVPAHTVADPVTLTSTELVTLLGTAGVSVSKTVPTSDEQAGVRALLLGGTTTTSYTITNPTASAISLADGVSDVAAYGSSTLLLTVDQALACVAAGATLTRGTLDYEKNRKVARILKRGSIAT